MAVFVECGGAGALGGGMGIAVQVEVGSDLDWSESLNTGNTSTSAALSDGVMTFTPSTSGYIAFGSSPDASVNPRRRLLSGIRMSFGVLKGEKVAWLEG